MTSVPVGTFGRRGEGPATRSGAPSYPALMDTATVVTPPHVAGPLHLAPFRALRLIPSRVGDPASARAFARPYRDVAQRLERWKEQGLIVHDPTPALYLHEYTGNGITVRGLVGALDVSRRAVRPEQRAILPHEGIYPAQADDLADRMAEMGLNPAPILLVQHSPAELRSLLTEHRQHPANHAYVDRVGQTHRLWAIDDPMDLATINRLLAPTSAVIADGHHRYAAYLRLQQRNPGAANDRGLAMIVDQDDTPLFLGAIHRVLAGSSVADVAQAARSLGIHIEHVDHDTAVAALGPSIIVATDNVEWLIVHLELEDDIAEVEVLHQRLIPTLAHGPRRLTYHHTAQDALEHAGRNLGTAILMPAPGFDRVQRIVLAGRVFPEKATSFQPKPPMGVLLRSVRDELGDPSSPPPPSAKLPRPVS